MTLFNQDNQKTIVLEGVFSSLHIVLSASITCYFVLSSRFQHYF